ncbi:hypothetical protein DYI21_19150 [Thalassospira tepidiphila]|jgi:hypothetical protein|uniref:hypothetical protein n=1 Tax=Thalassospira tepidiphila TaxID=393657 RepID=UPI001BD0C852|nr:hypothetical protein [Thalassospira tepidiphila]MBS8275715.1 hypothetical protein [Thalassospira tepidiphila]
MQELEITDGRIVRIWWLLTWRTYAGAIIGSALLAFVISIIIGFVGSAMGKPDIDVGYITGLAGFLWSFFWYFVVIKMMLRKRFNGFRLAIVADEPAPSVEPDPSAVKS